MSVGIKNNIYIGLRGLTRGNIHWGDFAQVLAAKDPQAIFIPLEMAGNGERANERSLIHPADVVYDLRSQLKTKLQDRGITEQIQVNIVSISLGGMIALKWAEMFPEEIENLFVINSSLKQLSSVQDRLFPKNYFRIIKMILFDDVSGEEENILRMTSNYYVLTKSYLPQFIQIRLKYKFHFLNFIRQLVLASRIKIGRQIKSKLVVIGSQNDRLVSWKCSQAIAASFKGQFYINKYSGHDLPLDDPEWLTQIILKATSTME